MCVKGRGDKVEDIWVHKHTCFWERKGDTTKWCCGRKERGSSVNVVGGERGVHIDVVRGKNGARRYML